MSGESDETEPAFFLLGDPWIERRDRGKTTAILYGSPDPHVATFFAGTDCLVECNRCAGIAEIDRQYVGEEVHRLDAEWLVKALNFAVNHPDGPGHPPTRHGRCTPCMEAEEPPAIEDCPMCKEVLYV